MNQPYNQVKASSIGCVLDCDLSTGNKIGGGTATDNTAIINGFLATASATNPIELILDGPTLTTGIVLPAGGYAGITGIGWKSGIFVKSGSNADPINNGPNLFAPTGTPPAQGGPIFLRNFMVNGNRGNGTTGNSTSGNPRGVTGTYWYCNITLYGVQGLRIENMYVYDSPAYSIRLVNCSDVVIDRNYIYNPSATFTANQDGMHLDGPCVDVYISNNYINNNFSDDAIAINPAEGYPGSVIDRVTIVGNTLVNVGNGLRVYGTSEAQVGSVVFSDNIGVSGGGVIWVGAPSVGATGDLNVRQLTCDNNTFSMTGNWVIMNGGAGKIDLSNCVWLNPTAAGSFISVQTASTISSISINNCSIYRTTTGSNTSSTLLAATAAATIKKFILNGFYVANEQGQSYAAIANLLAMTNVTITQLHVAALDYTNITAFADSYANIGTLAGPAYPNKQVIAANKTTAYTVVQTDAYLRGDATTATFAFTLPAGPYTFEEHEFIKVDSTANAVTIAGNGKTINGTASLGTQWSHAKLRYNGTTWDSL